MSSLVHEVHCSVIKWFVGKWQNTIFLLHRLTQVSVLFINK